MKSLEIKNVYEAGAWEHLQIADPREVVGVSLLLHYVVNTCWGGDPLYECLARVLNLISPW
jgi:hypothetical protein